MGDGPLFFARLSGMKSLTMLLGGLWHGAGWHFVLWGFLHGGYLAVEKMTGSRKYRFFSRVRSALLLLC